MWAAIQSDLADFVTTIKEDTSKTLNQVLGEEDDEEDTTYVVQNKLIADLRRSYETYSTPVSEKKAKEFDKYVDNFTLSEFANDIASVLDEEPEVSRFYAELVPAQVTPEEFWARLFFRVKLVYRHAEHEEDDEEEELAWDSEVPQAVEEADETCRLNDNQISAGAAAAVKGSRSTFASSGVAKINSQMSKRIVELEDENSTLKGQVRTLVGRVAQLEQELKLLKMSRSVSKDSEIHSLALASRDTVAENDSACASSPATSSSNQKGNAVSPTVAMGGTGSTVDTASISSENSGFLVTAADINSYDGESGVGGQLTTSLKSAGMRGFTVHEATAGVASGASASTAAPVTEPQMSSKESKEKFLADLDDDEGEEDGWN